jgi:hypothetical protein
MILIKVEFPINLIFFPYFCVLRYAKGINL